MIRIRCVLLAVTTTGLLFVLSGEDSLKEFASKEYGYSVQYPANWVLDPIRAADTLDIIDFPPNRAIRVYRIPFDGAAIQLAPADAWPPSIRPRTLEQMIEHQVRGQKLLSRRTLDLRGASGPLKITEIHIIESSGMHFVDWFFELQGRLFEAGVSYWEDHNADPRKLLMTMEQVVMSLRVSDRQ